MMLLCVFRLDGILYVVALCVTGSVGILEDKRTSHLCGHQYWTLCALSVALFFSEKAAWY